MKAPGTSTHTICNYSFQNIFLQNEKYIIIKMFSSARFCRRILHINYRWVNLNWTRLEVFNQKTTLNDNIILSRIKFTSDILQKIISQFLRILNVLLLFMFLSRNFVACYIASLNYVNRFFFKRIKFAFVIKILKLVDSFKFSRW